MASGILKLCIRSQLGNFQRNTLFELCDVLSELLAEELDSSYLHTLKYRVHRALALLERDFPVSLNVIVFHLLHHLPFFCPALVQQMDSGCTHLNDSIRGYHEEYTIVDILSPQ